MMKAINAWKIFTIFVKIYILGFWQGSEYASVWDMYFFWDFL